MYKKKNIVIIGMIAVVLLMAVGYAVFQQNLTINGSANIASNWLVEFTKIEKIDASSGATEKQTPTASGTTATFDVNLVSPGDYLIYQITVANKGTLDAIIENIDASDFGNEVFKFEILEIKQGDKLPKSTTKTFQVKMSFDSSVTSQPSITDNTLTVSINYVQDTGQTITPSDPIITEKLSAGTEVLFNPVSYSKCSAENTADNCYKWYVLKDDGSNVDMILNRNLGSQVAWNSDVGGRSNGPVTLLNYLANQTQSWDARLTRSDIYEEFYQGLVSLYSIDYTGYKARLATTTELNALGTGNLPSWLSTNLSGAYWLASASLATDSDSVDVVFMGGTMNTNNIEGGGFPTYLRPVITIPRSII